jgi:hypothetical protein
MNEVEEMRREDKERCIRSDDRAETAEGGQGGIRKDPCAM